MKFITSLAISSCLLLTYSPDACAAGPAKNSFKDSLDKANTLFEARAYRLALPVYQYLLGNETDKKKKGFCKYRLGICCLYKTDQYERALTLLTEVLEENKKAADIQFYLGRANMLNHKFDDAVVRFTEYMINSKASALLKAEAEQYIANCKNAKDLVARPADVKITNLGEPVNSPASEYVPVISSDESVLIFTYRGKKSTGGLQYLDINNYEDQYTEDVFMSVEAGDEWLEPFSAGTRINSIDHDACIALSGDGQKLFVFKNTASGNGDIFMSFLDGNTWTAPEPLQGDVNTTYWEGSCSINANERTLYFSSERPGGYGGRDLYRANLQPDGSWGEVKNLGPQINTAQDDDAPFIHPDGTTLIFSSKGHSSMGGYDIFKSFRRDTAWTAPENLGYPINTIGNDIYYVLSADGNRGYYSSEKAGGLGEQDIYVVGPGMTGWKPALVLLKGNITLNDQPVHAEVEVVLANNNENIGMYKSNASTGKYLVNLPAGADYKIIYRKPGYLEQTKTIANANTSSFSEINYDVKFYDSLKLTFVDIAKNNSLPGTQRSWTKFEFSTLPEDTLLLFLLEGKRADSIPEISVVKNEVTHTIKRCREKYFCLRTVTKVNAGTPEAAKTTAEIPYGKAENYPEMVKAFGDIHAEGLEFRVQIGAYRNPQNFKYDNLTTLGTVSKKDYEDQITRFTMGSFSALGEADKFLSKVLTKGRTDAFVTAFYNGKRFLLRDLPTLKK